MHQIVDFAHWPIQNESLRRLHDSVVASHTPHALLLVGPLEQTTHLAAFLAQLLLCTGETAPCRRCESCRQFEAGNHPDFHVIQTEATVKTSQVKEIQDVLRLRPHGGGRLVYVIEGMENATPVAANRLLKTLEEPPEGVIAILTATSVRRVLPTILSRCQVFRTGSGDAEVTWADGLRALNSADPQDDLGFASILAAVVQWAQTLLDSSEPPLLLADSLQKISTSSELPTILQVLSTWLRDVMHCRAGDLTYIRYTSFQADLEKQAKLAAVPMLAEAIEIVLDTNSRLQAHVAPNLNVEQMCIRLRGVFHAVHRSRSPL